MFLHLPRKQRERETGTPRKGATPAAVLMAWSRQGQRRRRGGGDGKGGAIWAHGGWVLVRQSTWLGTSWWRWARACCCGWDLRAMEGSTGTRWEWVATHGRSWLGFSDGADAIWWVHGLLFLEIWAAALVDWQGWCGGLRSRPWIDGGAAIFLVNWWALCTGLMRTVVRCRGWCEEVTAWVCLNWAVACFLFLFVAATVALVNLVLIDCCHGVNGLWAWWILRLASLVYLCREGCLLLLCEMTLWFHCGLLLLWSLKCSSNVLK